MHISVCSAVKRSSIGLENGFFTIILAIIQIIPCFVHVIDTVSLPKYAAI